MDDNKKELLNAENAETDNIEVNENVSEASEEVNTENVPVQWSTRSNIIWMLCGAYLIYTGYNLLSGFIAKSEGSSIKFGIVGVIFMVLGAVFAFFGGKRWLANDKKKREEEQVQEENAEENSEEVYALKRSWKASAQSGVDQGKKLSIAERARMGSVSDDEIEDEENEDEVIDADPDEVIELDVEE